MSRTVIYALAFLALICFVNAHAGHKTRSSMPYGWRAKRAVAASTCGYMQCAVSHGNCGATNTYCIAGEHCTNSVCTDDIALGGACNIDATENECAEGTCVNTGSGAICQIFQEILPGNPCTADSQCYFSQTADGSGSHASTCVLDSTTNTKKCAGYSIGQACSASHQCLVGAYCSSATSTCTSLGNSGDSCTADSECNSRYTCLNKKCSSRYTQSEKESCSSTDQCKSGLYCSTSGTCTKIASSASSNTPCDIASNNCPSNEQCSCKNFTVANQAATCSAIKGTYSDMATIEKSAYACLDKFNCGSDTNNATTVSCITNNCLASYCTFFTRHVNQLFSEYPSCLVSRMVDSADYYKLLTSCNAYTPSTGDLEPNSENAGSLLSASFAWVTLVSLAVFFFSF